MCSHRLSVCQSVTLSRPAARFGRREEQSHGFHDDDHDHDNTLPVVVKVALFCLLQDPQCMTQALTNVLLMDAVVGCLHSPKPVAAASKLAYFDKITLEGLEWPVAAAAAASVIF